MALEKIFSLTPKKSYLESHLYSSVGYPATIATRGIAMDPKYDANHRESFDHQYAADELWFSPDSAGDAAADYTLESERMHVPRVILQYDLSKSKLAPQKEIALVFRFDEVTESRILIYTGAARNGEKLLHPGDDEFLIEVENTEAITLHFIHVRLAESNLGGSWYFRGINGYIA